MESFVEIGYDHLPTPEEIVAAALLRCRSFVIGPFYCWLRLIGWRRWSFSVCWSACYPIIVILALLVSFSHRPLTCHLFGESFYTGPQSTEPQVMKSTITTQVAEIFEFKTLRNDTSPPPLHNLTAIRRHSEVCDRSTTRVFLPGLLTLLAYAIGYHCFRVVGNDRLCGLVETVFMQTLVLRNRADGSTEAYLITLFRTFIVTAILWQLATVGLHALVDYLLYIETYPHGFASPLRISLLVLDLLGYTVEQAVLMVSILQYSLHCEVIRLYIKCCFHRLREKNGSLNDISKDLQSVSEAAHFLNGTPQHLASVVIFRWILLICFSIADFLFNSSNPSVLIEVTQLASIALYILPILSCFVQAARVQVATSSLRRSSYQLKVFGYCSEPMAKIDSFVGLATGIPLDINICGVAATRRDICWVLALLVFAASVTAHCHVLIQF